MMKTAFLMSLICTAPLWSSAATHNAAEQAAELSPQAATLVSWSKSGTPVVCVQAVKNPPVQLYSAQHTPLLMVRVLSGTGTCLDKGVVLLLDTAVAADAGYEAPCWVLNLDLLQNLRSLHGDDHVLTAQAPVEAMIPLAYLSEARPHMNSWSGLSPQLQFITPQEAQRATVVCRLGSISTAKRFEKDGRWYEDFYVYTEMALPEFWWKGCEAGGVIELHWPVQEVSGPSTTEAERAEHERRRKQCCSAIFMSDTCEREGDKLILFADKGRFIPANGNNVEVFEQLALGQNAEDPYAVQVRFDESSPYIPIDDEGANAKHEQLDCHYVYRKVRDADIVVRVKQVQKQIIRFNEYHYRAYYTVEVQEQLKGSGFGKGRRITYHLEREGEAPQEGVYPADEELYLCFGEREGVIVASEKALCLGDCSFRPFRVNERYAAAMKRVLQEHPSIFGLKKRAPREKISHDRARELAIEAVKAQYGAIPFYYNSSGVGDGYLLLSPPDAYAATWPRVLVNCYTGKIARMFPVGK